MLSSYAIKSIAIMELMEWPNRQEKYKHQGENLANLVLRLLKRLLTCLNNKNLPYVFISDHNMFCNTSKEDLVDMSNFVSKAYKDLESNFSNREIWRSYFDIPYQFGYRDFQKSKHPIRSKWRQRHRGKTNKAKRRGEKVKLQKSVFDGV